MVSALPEHSMHWTPHSEALSKTHTELTVSRKGTLWGGGVTQQSTKVSPPQAVRRWRRTSSRRPSVSVKMEKPRRSVSIQMVGLEQNQLLGPTAPQSSMASPSGHLTRCPEGDGNTQGTDSSVGYEVGCSCWLAMTLKQSFCLSNILKVTYDICRASHGGS